MKAPKNAHAQNEPPSGGHSLTKNLAVATVAASLGIALGVNVGDVLAAEKRLDSPPNISRQDKDMVSKQLKDTNQVQQSTQQKVNQSKQTKINTQTPQTMIGK